MCIIGFVGENVYGGTFRVFTEGLFHRSEIAGIDERCREPHTCEYLLENSKSAPVDIFAHDDVGSLIIELNQGADGCHPACESSPSDTIFQARNQGLEDISGWIASPGIIISLMDAR